MPLLKALGLILAFACSHTLSQTVIANDTYFYGESPPVYPSPNATPSATGNEAWIAAYAKAQAFVAQLTIEEKTNLTGGYSDPLNGCGGNIWPIERLGFPGLCVTDAGNGVRSTTFVNGYASGVHVGASWNKEMTFSRGINMGGEFKTKGVNVQLGPVVGPIGRIAEGGRNWEGFSNDPYLAGALVGQYIQGAQLIGAGTCTKHFIGNEQETNRNPGVNAANQTIQSISANIDDISMHELYLWPFAEAVRAGTVSIMCSYNRINNSYGCQNSKILNGILKTELGFQGFVMSDWNAQHSGVASTLAGLDMTMPLGDAYWGANLTESVQNGSVSAQRLDDMVTRIMATWYLLGQDSSIPQPGYGIPADLTAPHQIIDARSSASRPYLLQEAIEGHVLVKNVNGALPLQNPKLLSIFGYDAAAPQTNDPTSGGVSTYSFGAESTDALSLLCGFGLAENCSPWLPYAPYGTLVTGAGSGATQPAYINAPFNAIQQRAIQDSTALLWDFATPNSTSYVGPTSAAALILINAQSTEGIDRTGLRDDFSDALVQNIAAQHNNTIVVIHNAGVRLVDQWIDNPNVTAVIFAHLPGQDSGAAITSILYGDVSPSGKLPYTVARNESDYGSIFAPVNATSGQYQYFPQDDFTEGVYIDYRAFDAKNITPRYEFGYGLTYTTFSYSNIVASTLNGGNNASLAQYPSGAIISGGHADLYDNIATVSATVTNTGTVTAAEVAQLYISIPAANQPVRQLRGFEKVMLAPNASTTVQFDLRRKDLSVWDVVAQQWSLVLGTAYGVNVGASSRDLPLTAEITL